MKKIVLTMMIAMLAMVSIQAQPQRAPQGRQQRMNPEQMVERRVDRLDKQLSLTAEQKKAITAIYTEQAKEMKAEMEQMRGKGNQDKASREEMKAQHEAMKARQEAADQKVVALLTPEQKTKYEQMNANRQAPRHHHGPKGGPKPGCDNAAGCDAAGRPECDKAKAECCKDGAQHCDKAKAEGCKDGAKHCDKAKAEGCKDGAKHCDKAKAEGCKDGAKQCDKAQVVNPKEVTVKAGEKKCCD